MAKRYKKVRSIEATVPSTLTGNAFVWNSPVAGTQTITADAGGDANLTVQQNGNRATLFITQGIDGGDVQETAIVATGAGGYPIAKGKVILTGAATVPEGPTINLVAGDGEITVNVTNGATGGSAITQHVIYTGTNPDELVAGAPVTQAASHVIAAVNDVLLYVRVAAKNAIGEGELSNLASATPEAPPIDPPDGVQAATGRVDQIAGTFIMTSTPQDGVTYTLKQTTHGGSTTDVGTLTSGNSYTRDVTGTLGKRLWISASDGGTPVPSTSSWMLDQRNIDQSLVFADYPDNSDFALIEVNGVSGTWVRSTGTSGDTKILNGTWVQAAKPSTAASYRRATGKTRQSFAAQVGIEGNDFSAWRHIRINLPASGVTTGEYVRLRIGTADWEISNTLVSNGSVVGTQYTGYWVDTISRNLEDGDYLYCGPTYGADGTLYYQLYVNMIPMITANSGKGLIISDPSKQVGQETQLSTHTLNNGVSRTLPWDWYHTAELRGHASTVFTLKTGTITAPTIDTAPRVTFEAFYSGTRSSFIAALFNKKTGQMLSDFETFSTSGSGLTGSHYLEFDPLEGGGEDVGILCFDPADISNTLSTMSCGFVQYYAAVPQVQYIGVNLQQRGEVDYFTDRFKYGFHLWRYMTSAGAELNVDPALGPTYPLDTDPDTGLIAGTISAAAAARVPPATRFSMYLTHPAPANSSDAGGSWKATTNLNPTYWEVAIGSQAFGVSGASVNPANNEVTWTAQAGEVGQLKIIIIPKSGYLDHLPPDGFYFQTGPVGTDFSTLMNPRYVADFGSATGRKGFRLMQMAGATDAYIRNTFKPTFPFIEYPAPVDSPAKISRMAAELGQMPWFCVQPLESNERMVEWGIEWARQLKAYDADGGVSSGLKWAGPFAFTLGNEIWNNEFPYGEAFKSMIPLAGEAGFIPGVTSKVILDHTNDQQNYVKWQGPGDYTILHTAMAPGVAVYGYFQSGDRAVIYNSTAGTIPVGTKLPTNFTMGSTTNGLTVAAVDSNMKGFCRDWMAWMLGVLADCLRYGIVPPAKGAMPQRLDLQDETVALGKDRIKMVFETWQAHTAESVAADLLAGGAGTEYARKIDGVGPSFYANVERNIDSPATQPWQIAIEAATNDTEYEEDAWPVFEAYLNNLVYGPNGTLAAIQRQFNGVYTLLRRAGIPADQCPKLWLYEGGVHFAVACDGGVTQSTKYHNFNIWLTGSTQYREFTRDMMEAVRQLAPEAMMSYVDIQLPRAPGDGNWEDFGIEDYPGSHTVQTEARYLGENDMLEDAGLVP